MRFVRELALLTPAVESVAATRHRLEGALLIKRGHAVIVVYGYCGYSTRRLDGDGRRRGAAGALRAKQIRWKFIMLFRSTVPAA